MSVLPPGTILQLMYLRERLRDIEPGHFMEIGPGSGEVTSVLLELGWRGVSYDLEPYTVELLKNRFSQQIIAGRYDVKNADFLLVDPYPQPRVNLIISCMVMEHLSDDLENKFMRNSSELLCDNGLMIGFVPSSPAHWGIEDDIAGHCRRYTREALFKLMSDNGWCIRKISGLTYPLSNILLPISNFLVRRAEKFKLSMTDLEKTKASGMRDVQFKTTFPGIFSLLLNRHALLPLHCLQKAFAASRNSLVLYFEASPKEINRKS
jgi:cyclopropane fatty-acyl-phospholipid synthase-like methyltransferase